MKLLDFDTDPLPAEERLAIFRLGASDFLVSPAGSPDAFTGRWRLLKLGEINAIHAIVSPIRYYRDEAMIEADRQDRVTIHYYVQGGSVGMLDGQPFNVSPGEATVWDLTRPIETCASAPLEMLIVTLPRFMLEEVLPAASYACVLPASPALKLAADQLRNMIDSAADQPDDAAAYFGRAIRDLFAVAMLPVMNPSHDLAEPAGSPLFLRVCRLIDVEPHRNFNEADIAGELGVDRAAVESVTALCGGLAELLERRRLLAAYRLLCDPSRAEPIATIVWQCGFSSKSRFNRRFQEVFQTTPTNLRLFQRGNLPSWAGAYHVEKKYGGLISS